MKQKIFNKDSQGATATQGFTLIEILISVALFAILAAGMLGAYSALSQTTKAAREKTILNSLASNYLEIVKNMPYSQIGTITGNPNGTLPDLTNAVNSTIGSIPYKIYYEVTYIDDPADGTAPTDVAAADYKQVKMNILNTLSNITTSFVTSVVPKGLEGINNAGALWIKVINASGQPVTDADIHIESPTTTPTLILDRKSDVNGEWIEVGLPARVEGYRIEVSKPGYSSDRTYARTVTNPNPIKPNATVVNGQVTEITFAIDLVATLNIRTLNSLCQNVDGVGVNVKGAKLIGVNPDVLKFNNSYSSVAGLIPLTNLEWDTYTPALTTGQSWIVRGTSPIQKIDVLPGAFQTFTIILDTFTTPNNILVIVKDSATGVPIEGAFVQLQKGGSQPLPFQQGAVEHYDTAYTGGSVWVQSDWTGGSGVATWSSSTPDRYFQDNGNIDVNSMPTGVRLRKVSGQHQSPGWVESGTFDTGTSASNYTTITWEPTSQNPTTELKFQVAANNDNATWDYSGPDGTNATYYTVAGTSISSALDGNRYVRYKAYLSTTDDRRTPVLTSVSINYVSGCFTPGQVLFKDLTAGNNYNIGVSAPGYTDQVINSLDINGSQVLEILMSP